jgi:hypothetical protein
VASAAIVWAPDEVTTNAMDKTTAKIRFDIFRSVLRPASRIISFFFTVASSIPFF